MWLNDKLFDLVAMFNHYRFNAHTIAVIKQIVCSVRGHNFETASIVYNRKGAPVGIQLKCDRCEEVKNSKLTKY